MRSLSRAAALAAERYYGVLDSWFDLWWKWKGKGCGERERVTFAAMMDGAMGWELRYYGRDWMNGDSMSKIL